jgi:hypothetical protein
VALMGAQDIIQQLGGVVERGVTTVYHRTEQPGADRIVAEGLFRVHDTDTGARHALKIPGKPYEVFFYWTTDPEAEAWVASRDGSDYGPARLVVTVNVSDLKCGKPWPGAPDETRLVELYVEAGADKTYRPISVTLG